MAKKARKKAPRKVGKPTKLTPERAEAACEAIADGGTVQDAANAAGVVLSTLMSWQAKGLAGREPYVEFVDALQDARDRRPASIRRRLSKMDSERALIALHDIDERRKAQPAKLRKLEAEASLAEAKARAAEKLADTDTGAQALLMPEQVLAQMPELARQAMLEALGEIGLTVKARRDLGGDVTDEDIARFSPNPPKG